MTTLNWRSKRREMCAISILPNPPRSAIKLERVASFFLNLFTTCSNSSSSSKVTCHQMNNSNRTRILTQPPGEITKIFVAPVDRAPYNFQMNGVSKNFGFSAGVFYSVLHSASFLSHSHRWMQMLRLPSIAWWLGIFVLLDQSHYAPLSVQWKTKVDTIFGYVNSLSLASMLNYPLTTPRLPVWCPLTDC